MIKRRITNVFAAAALAVGSTLSGSVFAEEELYFYNWIDYTPPELLERFTEETGIKVILDTYDSNETLLAKLKSGATGYDLVVPSQNFVTIMIDEGMLEEVDVKSMSNYGNVDERWRGPSWDPEQKYSSPWQMGTTSFAINMAAYDGPGNSLEEFFRPNEQASGKLQVFRTPDEVIPLALMLLGLPQCNENPEDMKKVQALLLEQKPHVKTYNSETMVGNLASGEVVMSSHWDGYAMKTRRENGVTDLKYIHPKEGIIGWFDSLVIPKGARNIENAKKFMNFIMDEKNGAELSNFNGYASPLDPAKVGPHLEDFMSTAPELNVDPAVTVHFSQTCSPKAIKLYDRVWTKLLQ